MVAAAAAGACPSLLRVCEAPPGPPGGGGRKAPEAGLPTRLPPTPFPLVSPGVVPLREGPWGLGVVGGSGLAAVRPRQCGDADKETVFRKETGVGKRIVHI